MFLNTLQSISQYALFAGIVLAALGGIGTHQFGKMVARRDRESAEALEKELRERLDVALSESRRLEAGHDALRERLAPFQEVAARMNPGVAPEEALGKLYAWVEKSRSVSGTAARRVSASAAKVIADTLRARGERTVQLAAVKGDAEGYQFALDLQRALQEAGWIVPAVDLELISGRPMGLIVQIRSTPAPEEAEWLMDAFKRAGLRPQGLLSPDLPENSYRVVVGSRVPRG